MRTADVRRRALTLLAAGLGGVLLLTGCGHSGSGAKPEKGPLTLASPAFGPANSIPINYSCAGADTSPPITWHGVAPSGTKSWAIVLTDLDVRPSPWVQWLVTDIPVKTRSLPAGTLPSHAVVGKSSNGTTGFVGVCPPSGRTHRYEFSVYAIGKSLSLSPGAPTAQALRAVTDASITRVTLTARFAR